MAYNNINDVVNDIKNKQGTASALKPIDTSSFLKAATNKIKVHEFDVPKAALYDRLSDGSYIAKYENYVGAKGNENRLAQKQSATEQVFNGLTKNLVKTFNYAADSIVGTAYGIASGISKGSLSAVYDNDFSNWMDDTNKKLDNKLANYYTDEEKSQNWLKSLGTVNFWANDVAGGLAFVGGALLPDVALAAVTGGATLSTSAAKFGAKIGIKALAKEGGESLIKAGIRKGAEKLSEKMGANALKTYTYARLGSKVGSVADNALFLARTSNFEAGMEARQNFKDSVDTFYNTFEEKNGRQPTYDEAKEFMNNARSAANGVYGANMAILSVSNAVMFGKKILPSGLSTKMSNIGNRLVGLGTKVETVAAKEGVGSVIQTSMRGASRTQKIVGRSYNLLRKPLTEGLYEEGFQGVAGKTMQNYLEAKYDPQHTDTYSAWSAMHDAFNEQYTSNEGWKEMGIGMIIGFAGGAIQPGAKFKDRFPGFGAQSWGAAYKAKESSIERSNKGIELLASMNRTAAVKAMSDARQSGKTDEFSENFENKINHYNFIKSQEFTSDMAQIRDTHDKIIDNLKIDEDTLVQLKDAGISEDSYRQSLKDEFVQNQKDYKMAKSTVEALGLDKKIKNTPGNLAEIGDALTLNIMLGKGALHSAKVVADEIDSAIGTSGIYSHLLHYANLENKDQDLFDQLVSTKSELDTLKANAAEQAQELNRLNSERLPGAKDVDSKYKATSQLAVLTQQKIAKLEKEQEKIKKSLQDKFDASSYNLKDVLGDSTTTTVEDVMNNLDKLDNLVSSFRKSGKTKEAAGVEYLMNKFKGFTDSHREMVNMQRNMADTNFFSSKQGKGLISNILGLNYQMSEELKKDIEDNNKFLDESLSLYGRRDYDTVQEKLKSVIEENEHLSDREKFRLESLIRLQLSTGAMEWHKGILENAYEDITADTEEAVNPMEGDTVALKSKLDLQERDLNNLDILNEAIDDITSQLDNILNAAEDNSEEINKLNEELNKLKAERDAIKEKQQQEQKSNEQGSSSEYQGADTRQQETRETEGGERETTQQGTNNSNSNQSSQVQKEEIENRRKESLDDITEDEDGQFTTPVVGKDGSFTIATDVSREEHIQAINDFYDREIAALGITDATEIENRRQEDLQNGELFLMNDGTYGGSRNVSLNFYSDVQIKEGNPEGDVRTWDYKNYGGTGIFVNKKLGIAYIVPNNTFSKTPQVFKVFMDRNTFRFDLNNPRLINRPNIDMFAKAYNVSADDYYNEVLNAVTKYDAEIAAPIDTTEIEKRRQEAEVVMSSAIPYNDKINKLVELGLLTTVTLNGNKTNTAIYNGRLIHFMNLNGTVLPIYRSSNGTSGKAQGGWYPFFGFGNLYEEEAFNDVNNTSAGTSKTGKVAGYGDQGWLIKGTGSGEVTYNYEQGHGIEGIQYMQGLFNRNAIFSVSAFADKSEFKSKGFITDSTEQIDTSDRSVLDFNKSIFGQENLGVYNGDSLTRNQNSKFPLETVGNINNPITPKEWIKSVVDKINETTADKSVQPNETFSDTEQQDNLNRLKDIEDRIKEIEDRISSLGERFRLLETEDFKRYDELLRKKEDGIITPEEVLELDKLKNNIDQWTMLTGVVVEGFRLSDLIQQKIVLEKTAIASVESVAVPTTEDTIDAVDFADRLNNANYRYGLTYQNAFISYQGSSEDEDSTITIHYLTEEAFNGYVKGKVDVPIERDSKNNIVIPAKFIKEINEKTDLRIVPTNQKMSTYYSVLLEVGTDVAGNQILKPIESTFRREFNNKQGHNIKAAFDSNIGDVVTMSIDPNDDYNKALISEYRKAVKFGKNVDEAKTKLKKELLILAKVGGKVVATFKKRSEGNKTQKDLIFEDVRNAIVDNDANIEALLKSKGPIEPKVINKDGKASTALITVSQVKFGHPNYNYILNTDGTIIVQSRTLAEGQIKAIKDIGYIQGAKTYTRDRKAVDTTYLTKLTNKKSTDKIPFIVLEVGGKRVAYPVTVGFNKIGNIDTFESIYNNENITATEKINKLNKFMAENGIDIKKSGEAFISFGTNNLNDEFFNKKLAELKAINYFYNVEDWVNNSNPMEEIVKNQISVDIDVLNPFHSPKLGFDYSKVDLQVVSPTSSTTTSSKKSKSKKKTAKKVDPDGKTSVLYGCKS